MSTMIKKCNCSHAQQDKMYGRQNRVFNLDYREVKGKCTVCGNTSSNPKK